MSTVSGIWIGVAAAVMTLGVIHLVVWISYPKALAHLLFSLTAFSVASFFPSELGMMHAASATEWAAWLRLTHLSAFGVLVGGILFVRVYLGTGRDWLMWAFITIRIVILVWNFLAPVGFTFRAVTGIQQIPYLGESVSVVATAVVNPWQWIALASLLLFILFILDAAISSWRKGKEDEKRKAIVVAGTMTVSYLLIFVQNQMVAFGLVKLPLVFIPSFVIMVAGLAYELGRDILRAKQLATALHESEERLGLAARSAGLGMWAWDLPKNTVWATDQTRALFGFRNDEPITYEQWTSAIHPEDLETVLRKVKASLGTESDFEAEYRICLAGGKCRWIAVLGRSEVSERDNAIVRGVIRDITSQKQTQVELDLLRLELVHAGRVTMLGQLNSALAHEIKQPLAAAHLNSAAAQKVLQTARPNLNLLREIQDDIEGDIDRANQVIDHLGTLLKRRSLETEAIVIEVLLEGVIALVHSESVARHVTIVTVASDAPPVLGDTVHLSQVLLNLIINAMDAVEGLADHRRRITIEARLKVNHMVEIAVTDFGVGIAADRIDKIFEPFFTTKPEGMGMGLSISRTIVEAHGGRIRVENRTDGGAVFRVTLPRAVPLAASAA
jgi:two-component system, LuxR family, sensor kinase FixL